MQDIDFLSEDSELPQLDFDFLRNCIAEIIAHYNRRCGSISIVFCSDNYILEVNRRYLNHDYYTDIITFDYNEGDIVSGDLVISLDTVQSNSIEFNTAYREELHRVIFHGILHLVGFGDKTDEEEKIMRGLEDFWLGKFSV